MAIRFLIMASEFVLVKTGRHYDEHLAELIQGITPTTDLRADFSGDAIRKKREHFKKTYPLIYSAAVRDVHAASPSKNASAVPIM